MIVRLTLEDVSSVADEGTLVIVTGTSEETGHRVRFAGDHRPMGEVIERILTDEEDEILLDVEDYQIIRIDQPVAAESVAQAVREHFTPEV